MVSRPLKGTEEEDAAALVAEAAVGAGAEDAWLEPAAPAEFEGLLSVCGRAVGVLPGGGRGLAQALTFGTGAVPSCVPAALTCFLGLTVSHPSYKRHLRYNELSKQLAHTFCRGLLQRTILWLNPVARFPLQACF